MNPSLQAPLVTAALALGGIAGADTFAVKALPDLPDPHGLAGAFAGIHRGQLLTGGGANFPDGLMPWQGGKKTWHDRLFALDLEAENPVWRQIGQLPEPNGYGVSLSASEGILLLGGGDAQRNSAKARLLSLAADGTPRFRDLPDLPAPRAQLCGALVGRKVHLCGGTEQPDSNRAAADHWCLDLDHPAAGWQSLPPLPGPGRILATAAACDGTFLVLGGCSLAPDAQGKPVRTYLREAWGFAAGRWQRLADPPRASVAAASPAPVRGRHVFLVSGDDGSQTALASPALHRGFTPEILRYDLGADAWQTDGQLSVPPSVTLPAVPWRERFLFVNGEVRPGVRTPRVFALVPAAP